MGFGVRSPPRDDDRPSLGDKVQPVVYLDREPAICGVQTRSFGAYREAVPVFPHFRAWKPKYLGGDPELERTEAFVSESNDEAVRQGRAMWHDPFDRRQFCRWKGVDEDCIEWHRQETEL